jgi:26S proteasome regulatory subunit N6
MESLDLVISSLERQTEVTPKLAQELTDIFQQVATLHLSSENNNGESQETSTSEHNQQQQHYDPATGRLRKQISHELEHGLGNPISTTSTTTDPNHDPTTSSSTSTENKFIPPPKKITPLSLFERVIIKLIQVFTKLQQASSLISLLHQIRNHFGIMPKAKTAKLVRLIIDNLGHIPNSELLQIQTCQEYIQWCKIEKRTFLRLRIESRLASLLLQRGENQQALEILKDLQVEIKKLDDKPLLVEIFLLESRAHLAHRNFPKAKASLTAARSSANAIYVAPLLQAEIDLQGGMLNAHDKDFRTAYSYFYESFENLSLINNEPVLAQKCLKYMLLCKIMLGQTEELPIILNGKSALPFATTKDVEAMKVLAIAYKDRSLQELQLAIEQFPVELGQDPVLVHHLSDLQTTMLETNLQRILEPYSHVEVSHVAKLIQLPIDLVENKLSQMILDKKFNGILDQGSGLLIIYDDDFNTVNGSYGHGMEVIERMNGVVDSLFGRG